MLKCGLLGEKLGHSYSPEIHKRLGNYEYAVYEKAPAQLENFIRNGQWNGLNVTIPYKKAVLPFCSELSDTAVMAGSVNTLIKRGDGSIFGDNTDVYGFSYLLNSSQIDPRGKKVLVLGNGGAAGAVKAALVEAGTGEVVTISRRGEDNYENIAKHYDAQLIINATPVGMYPNNGGSVIGLSDFGSCEGLVDLIYNPARTQLILQARRFGIRSVSGLGMLAAQAKRAAELFTGESISEGKIEEIVRELSLEMQNIVLIGMPGCGKSTVARMLAQRLDRSVYDTDTFIEAEAGMDIPEIFRVQGEAEFRRKETAAIEKLGKLSGAVISTGGGCVETAENYELLHQNGTIIWLKRDVEKLSRQGRPLSLKADLSQMYARRAPLYDRFADACVHNDGDIEQTVESILKVLDV